MREREIFMDCRTKRWAYRLFGLLLVAVSIWCVLGCASVPHTGRRQFNFISDQSLKAVANKVYAEVTAKEPECADPRLKEIVARVVKRISRAAEKMDHPGFDWKVVLIQQEVPIAYCLPGGIIVIHSGIVPYVRNEAGLAAVVGHEAAHAVSRHGGERVSQSMALGQLLSLGQELMRDPSGELTPGARKIVGALGIGATVGIILPYSRVHEFEADQIGQVYMSAAGYDPGESVRLWDRMSKIKKPPIPAWLSTHPSDEDRVAKLRQCLPDAKKYYDESREKYGVGSLL